MSKILPKQAQAVIIGGGVVGCSVAYHLAKLGYTDVVLLERKKLTSGTTWHAAGLVGQMRSSLNLTQMVKYSGNLYETLEAETGMATGYRRTGSVSLATNQERLTEYKRNASLAKVHGVDVQILTTDELRDKVGFFNLDDVVGGAWIPKDGKADPANVAMALAKGAKNKGVKIFEDVKVTGILKENGKATGVQTEFGEIQSEVVVNCGGMWAREVGKMAGVSVPLHACEHFYFLTSAVPGLGDMPVVRVPDESAYYKEDAGKMLLGAFEPVSKPWAIEGIPVDFEFDQLPEDFDHFEPILEKAVSRMPMLGSAGIHTFFNGPESFTPDDAYHLGLAPEMDNVWVAAGFNSVGIQSAGGAGQALAQWMEDGQKPFDLGDVDIGRMQPFQGNKHYLFERSKETLGLLYADHFPYLQKKTARGVRRTPFHHHLKENGAVFGELAGWERANWFANPGQDASYAYSWKRQNFFDNIAAEHKAVRNNLGLYDMSSFGKIRVEGPDACAFMNYIGGGQYDVPQGKIVYTQFLNDRAGIEADVTVTRLSEACYLVVTPAATRLADQTWMMRHKGAFNVVITDVTAGEGVLAVMGPNARKLLERVSPNDFSNANNPFGTAQEIELGMGLARVHRVTYVGELGWEVYVSTDMAGHAFETLWQAGQEMNAKLCGMHMMDSCRIEKGFRHFGHDITCEDHVLEAGLGFAVKMDKAEFIGRDAVLRKKEAGLNARMVQFKLTDPEPLLYHNEPVLRDGEIVGYLSSGNYGHHLGGAIGLGYVPCAGESVAEVLASSYEIDVAGTRVVAEASMKPLYDPTGARAKA